jgi:hypothetical protein
MLMNPSPKKSPSFRFLALAAAFGLLMACDKTGPTGPASTKMLDLTAPATGSVWKVGDSLAVNWTVRADPTSAGREVGSVEVFLSPDSGKTWGSLTRSRAVVADANGKWNGFKWKITDSLYIQSVNQSILVRGSHACRIWIRDYTLTKDPDLSDTSGVFTINPLTI